ncbi:OLC1v1020662C1 [Oldenlandia corymbosa var. corymbosa]|uniref:OLC1v1020662C1 n=1 Tax=Oldenlandia corymbosa var. corymbosa TaxID=529605 RepID=A0AAV1EH53_OLDCO|nr:OLC1v1020662C1 [Oldenlandia corymbosa var. corymbosa]
MNMGAEKHSSKSGGGYVGGLLQLFDWNAKSRKKLFSSKSTLPEQSKQKKRCDGNLPTTRFHLVKVCDFIAGSSIRGSNYSCASSVTDEDFGEAKAPGVVARLMGLDSMPTSNFPEPYASPYFSSQSLQGFNSHSKNLDGSHEFDLPGNLYAMDGFVRNNVPESRHPKPLNRPIEKFQTEVLPPKSAKSIPITHHKLLSPIKSANYIPSENAAHIMEAAARIIGPSPQTSAGKVKFPAVSSTSIPLKVRDLKEKVEASQKPLKLGELTSRPGETNAPKHTKGQNPNRSWNSSADTLSSRLSSDSEEASAKGKGKSISLALQAKANVQKREGLNGHSSSSLVGQKESSEVSSSELFKSQASAQSSRVRKSSTHTVSSVLRQNNQKQNGLPDKGKLSSKPCASGSQNRKINNGESSYSRYKSSGKNAANSKIVSKRSKSEVAENRREETSGSRNIASKKRSIDGNFQFEKNHTPDKMMIGKSERPNALTDKQSSFPETSKRIGTDVVSFTFTAPMTRSFALSPETFREVREKSNVFSADFCGKRSLLTSSAPNSAKFSLPGHNVVGADALSTLLEQKLRELTQGMESSSCLKAGTSGNSSTKFQDSLPNLDPSSNKTCIPDYQTQDWINADYTVDKCSSGFSSSDLQGFIMKHKVQVTDQGMDSLCRSNLETRKILDHRLPSPVSVLENSIFAESWNSSDTTDSINTGGSKQVSSVQAQEVLGIHYFKKPNPMEIETELSDSASSMSTAKTECLSCGAEDQDVLQNQWELEYVKDILSDIEHMFKDFAAGRARAIINHNLFDQLESKKWMLNRHEPKLRRKIIFDCVAECLDIRCKEYASGGCEMWTKGSFVVRNTERLAAEIYKEISGWNDMGDCMVDELVDQDMSKKHGRWLDFKIEAFELGVQIENRLLNNLLDEVIADILVL